MREEIKEAGMELAMRLLEEKHAEQRNSLYEYVKFYWETEKKEPLDENWHLRDICDKLEKVYY